MEKYAVIAKELMRIAKMISAGETPSGIREISMISDVVDDVLPGAHADDEYQMHLGETYWDFRDEELSEGDFSDKEAYAFLVGHDRNSRPLFRAVFAVNVEEHNMHWSGRHDDYDPSYDYDPFPNGDEIAVFASIEDVEDGGKAHRYDITGAIGKAALGRMSAEIENIGKYDKEEVLPQASDLDDGF